ncbi:MAG TPA: dipeptide ABC transporter ATP-binding protein [Marinagarivorans sp.]|nr:dipeptide ABC transporter ATP-binding protein [Marinagarivorans sp.]HNG61556.1 dipeptide ABC transporter ATP-binding protein [Cellvibrionaceae bacterium]
MSEPLLAVSHLSAQFTGAGAPCLLDVSFTLQAGKTLALVGESGSGKSVTAQSIMRLFRPQQIHFDPQSRIDFNGQNLLALSERQLNRVRGAQIGFIFQEPMTALNPLHTIGKQIGEVIALHRGLRGAALQHAVVAALQQVQLDDAEQKYRAYPHQLSGGQRQRVLIAMALANQPQLLIADEPTTALDAQVQKHILDLLKTLQQDLGLTLLLISHDLPMVRRYADAVAVMHKGRIVEQGPVEAVFNTPRSAYTQELLGVNEMPITPVPIAVDAAELLQVANLNVDFVVQKSFWGKPLQFFPAVQQAHFTLRAGQTLGVIGESGSGKSTLVQALLRLIPATGKVVLQGQDLFTLSAKALRPLRRHMQMVFQDPFSSLSPRLNILEIIAEGLQVFEPNSQTIEAQVIEVMQAVGLDADLRYRYPHEFSGGQRQRIAIARALILKPQIIILDEPTSALDRTVQRQVLLLLQQLQRQYGLAFILISHDYRAIKALSHQIAVMQRGKIVEYGAAEQVFNQPQVEYTRQLLQAVY